MQTRIAITKDLKHHCRMRYDGVSTTIEAAVLLGKLSLNSRKLFQFLA